jgi:hypothetical protein
VFHTPAQSFRTRHGEREKHTLQQTSQLVPQLLVPNSFLKKKKKKKKKKRPKKKKHKKKNKKNTTYKKYIYKNI